MGSVARLVWISAVRGRFRVADYNSDGAEFALDHLRMRSERLLGRQPTGALLSEGGSGRLFGLLADLKAKARPQDTGGSASLVARSGF